MTSGTLRDEVELALDYDPRSFWLRILCFVCTIKEGRLASYPASSAQNGPSICCHEDWLHCARVKSWEREQSWSKGKRFEVILLETGEVYKYDHKRRAFHRGLITRWETLRYFNS